jgi:hypothetical protein
MVVKSQDTVLIQYYAMLRRYAIIHYLLDLKATEPNECYLSSSLVVWRDKDIDQRIITSNR